MKKVLFTHNDRFLLHHQHRDMICTSSSDESEEEYELNLTKGEDDMKQMLKASHVHE